MNPRLTNAPEKSLELQVVLPSLHLEKHFAGYVENVFFADLGIPETGVVAYLTDLLVRKMSAQPVAFRTLDGTICRSFSGLLEEAEARIGEAQLKAYRDMGEDVLFRFGFFPIGGEPVPTGESGLSERESINKFGREVFHRLSVLSPVMGPNNVISANPIFAYLAKYYSEIAFGLGSVREAMESEAANSKGAPLARF